MNSLTKTDVSEKTIRQLLQKAAYNNVFFGEDTDIISCKEMKNGYFNTVYLLRLKSREVILKISPLNKTRVLRYEKNIMKAEAEVLDLVLEKTGLPVPKVYFYDTSQQLGDFEYFFMEKMSGAELNSISESISNEEKAAIEFELGAMNRRINEISGTKFGYYSQPQKQSDSWAEAFSNIVSDIIEDGKDAKITLPYGEIEGVFKSFSFACDDIKEPKLAHWDLWPGNVLVEKGKISGLIDFERALWGDPLMEYYFSGLSDNESFCAGYGITLSELDRNAKIRRSLYNLYIYLVLKIECYYRDYEDSSQKHWAKQRILNEIKNFEKI